MSKITVEKLHTLTGHKDSIYTLEGTNESTFFSAGGDGMVASWNLKDPENGKLVAKVPNSVYSLHWIAEENYLIVGQNFEGLHLIDLKDNKELQSLKMTTSSIFDIQRHQNVLFIATGDGQIISVDYRSFNILKTLKLSDKSVRSLAVYPEKEELIAGFSDNQIRVIDLKTFAIKKTIDAHKISVFTVELSADSNYLISGSRDAHIKTWDARSNYEMIEAIPAHMYAINHITFSPDGNYFSTCSMDKSIKVWDAHQFKLLKVIDKARHCRTWHLSEQALVVRLQKSISILQ